MQKLQNKILFLAFFVVFTLASVEGYGQTVRAAEDMKFIEQTSNLKSHFHKRDYIFKDETSKFVKYNPVSMVMGGLLYVYQNAISQQLSANCLFHPSCSEFSKQSIVHYGLFKGVFLSADRLTRCNKISSLDIHPLTIDQETRKSKDPVSLYKWVNLIFVGAYLQVANLFS